MVEFDINTRLGRPSAILRREGKEEQVVVSKPFYEREISVRWINGFRNNKTYIIKRSGKFNKSVKIYKKRRLFCTVEANFSINSTILVKKKDELLFKMLETTPLKGEFEIIHDGARIGLMKLTGLHLPLLSKTTKGVKGYFNHLKPSEEELLVLSLISIGV
ncbi:MAG: hypothetical protein J7L23_04635 [Candidatus Diapherotrites archaeon]|nr:hypothetical protein [Candidatus Diapherotrites archaeon]